MLYVLSKCWLLSLYLVHTKYVLSIYLAELVPKGPFTKRAFWQKVLLGKVLWCKGPFDQRSFDFGGPLAKGPFEKVLCDKVLLLKVPLPQPIFEVWYNNAKKFQKSLFEDFVYTISLYKTPSDIFELIQAIPPCRILLNSIQLGENLSVLFCFDFYYIELPQRLKLLQIYVFSIFYYYLECNTRVFCPSWVLRHGASL